LLQTQQKQPRGKDRESLASSVQLGQASQEDVMNRNLIGTLSLAVLSITLTSGAYAQSIVKANVPFAFNVGASQLPAGQYQIKEDHTRLSISILNVKTGALVTIPVHQDSYTAAHPTMIFRNVGDRHFLARISETMDDLNLTLPISKFEKQFQAVEEAKGQAPDGQNALVALK
jgi:hypothetical protein